jgi:hypothetical protein
MINNLEYYLNKNKNKNKENTENTVNTVNTVNTENTENTEKDNDNYMMINKYIIKKKLKYHTKPNKIYDLLNEIFINDNITLSFINNNISYDTYKILFYKYK